MDAFRIRRLAVMFAPPVAETNFEPKSLQRGWV